MLKSIKDVFLNYSLNEREKKLNQIIGFINNQIPKLQKSLSKEYEKLAKLRIENNILDPLIEGESIKEKLFSYDLAIQSLREEEERLLNLKEMIASNDLSLEVFSKYLNSSQIVLLENVNKEKSGFIFKEIIKLEKQFAKAKSIYLPESNKIKSIELS